MEGLYPEQFTGEKCSFQSKRFDFTFSFPLPELQRSSWVCHSVKPLTCGHWAVSLLSCFWAGLCIQEHLSTTRWEHVGGVGSSHETTIFCVQTFLNPPCPASASISAHCCCLSSFSLCAIPIVSGQGARSCVCFHLSWVYPVQKKGANLQLTRGFQPQKLLKHLPAEAEARGVRVLVWNTLCNFTTRAVFPFGDRASLSFLSC